MWREAEPRTVAAVEDCYFYHSMDLPTYGYQSGDWDLIGRFDEYTAEVPLAGRTVLDVGTASGFLTFEAERRGATVTSLDASSVDQFYELPMREAEFVRDHQAWRVKRGARFERQRNSYWLSYRDLGSKARCVYGDVYDIDETVGVFDVVLVGQILIHLRDGISALTAAASVCRDTIVITEGSFENDTPIAALAGRADTPEVAYAWYQYSTGWYREVLTMLGFTVVSCTTAAYSCVHPDMESESVDLTTVAARRSQPAQRMLRGLLADHRRSAGERHDTALDRMEP